MRQGEKQWMMKIVNAIQAGDTVILENIGETLDASLDSVLTKVCMYVSISLLSMRRIGRAHTYMLIDIEGSVPQGEDIVLKDRRGRC